MAIDYDGNPDGLFFRIGRLIAAIDDHDIYSTLETQKLAIVDPFESADLAEQAESVYTLFASAKASETSLRQRIADVAGNVLSDRVTCLSELGLLEFDPSTFWSRLWRRMVADTETIKRSSVSIGSITAGASNVGNGTILTTAILDGYNPPVSGAVAVRDYATTSTLSELCVSETMRFDCITDQGLGAAEGAESFTWHGAKNDTLFGEFEGSDDGPTLVAAGAIADPFNGTFESFTDDTPAGWTVVAPTVAATHVFETTTSGEFYRGDAGLKIVNSGAVTDLRIETSLSQLDPLRMYCLHFRFKASSVPGAGTLKVSVTSDTAGDLGSKSLAAASFPTSWTLYSAFFVTPGTIQDDTVFRINLNALSNSVPVYIDDVFLSPVVYHGGIGAVIVPGSTAFAERDYFTTALTATEYLFARFFRRWARAQLPSTGSPSIDDALAS